MHNYCILPVCFIKNDNFVLSFGEGDLLMSKHLNPITNNIDTSEESWSQN